MDSNWFKTQQKKSGLNSFDLGELIGRDRTVISRIVNGHQKPTLEQAKIFANAFNEDLPVVLEKLGLADKTTAQSVSPGFNESDAAAWIPQGGADADNKAIANSLGANRPGVDVWQIKKNILPVLGYIKDDYIIVDTHKAERAQPGDIVLAQVYDNTKGTASTILRRYEPPVLLPPTTDPDNQKVHVVDGINVVIRGVVWASWRRK